MKTALSILFTLCFFSLIGQNNTFSYQWANTFGNTGIDRGCDLKTDASGDVYVTGRFKQTVDFDPTSGAVNLSSPNGIGTYVCKYSNSGNLIWASALTGSGDARVLSLDLSPQGNIFISGEYTGTIDFDPGPNSTLKTSNGVQDAFLVKLSPNGSLLWAQTFGGNYRDIAYSVHAFSNNITLIGGKFSGTVDFDPGNANVIANGSNSENIFLSAFDANGNLLWNNTFLTSNNSTDYANLFSVNQLQNGNLIVCGSFFGTVDFDPTTATSNLNSNGNEDCFLASYDPNGNYLWANSWGGSSEDIATSLAVDQYSNVYVGGSFRGMVDFDPSSNRLEKISTNTYRDIYISKFDQSGNLLWNQVAGGTDTQYINRISTNDVGEVYAVGYTFSAFDANPDPTKTENLRYRGNADVFVWGLDSTGNFNRAYSMGNTAYDNARGVTITNQNELFVCGDFNLSVDFDPDSSTVTKSSVGSMDAFFQKLNICTHTADSIFAFGCQFYVSPGNKFFNTNGTYFDTIPNQQGCDSVLTINLQLNQLNTTVSRQGNTLQANINQSVSYQWLDCNNAYAAISGENQASYTATTNGSFAVEVTQGSCRDTSACYQILGVGLDEKKTALQYAVFPNPGNGTYSVQGIDPQSIIHCSLYNINGKLVKQFNLKKDQQFNIEQASGLYFLQIQLDHGQLLRKKIVKK